MHHNLLLTLACAITASNETVTVKKFCRRRRIGGIVPHRDVVPRMLMLRPYSGLFCHDRRMISQPGTHGRSGLEFYPGSGSKLGRRIHIVIKNLGSCVHVLRSPGKVLWRVHFSRIVVPPTDHSERQGLEIRSRNLGGLDHGPWTGCIQVITFVNRLQVHNAVHILRSFAVILAARSAAPRRIRRIRKKFAIISTE
ncbi:hypothetical protein BDN72DRAFT_664377 [Pluteus cervinus]|uniref:Uncharacterized protein n=1 Tax=Pluteus cervinus TaxID=181527 RepID=A0ACD3B9P0_9AGAR|nr:hypothetical protein BDN72DRAFT_664377 [Pluteus cervinus]